MIIKLTNKEVAVALTDYLLNKYDLDISEADYTFDMNGAYTFDTDKNLVPRGNTDED